MIIFGMLTMIMLIELVKVTVMKMMLSVMPILMTMFFVFDDDEIDVDDNVVAEVVSDDDVDADVVDNAHDDYAEADCAD